MTNTTQDGIQAEGIEAQVCADIARRQQLGLSKYGTTVANNPLELRAWLQHAYEEMLDAAVYLRRAMAELDGEAKKKEADPPGWDMNLHNPEGVSLADVGPCHRLLTKVEFRRYQETWAQDVPDLEYISQYFKDTWQLQMRSSPIDQPLWEKSTYRIPLETPPSTGKEAGHE